VNVGDTVHSTLLRSSSDGWGWRSEVMESMEGVVVVPFGLLGFPAWF